MRRAPNPGVDRRLKEFDEKGTESDFELYGKLLFRFQIVIQFI